MYHFLIPQIHHPANLWPSLFLGTEFINWGGLPPVPRCLPAVSEFTPVWGVIPLHLVPLHPGDIQTPCPPQISPSSRDPSGFLTMKPLQKIQHRHGYHPTFTTIQQQWLCHWLIQHTTDPYRCSSLLQHPQNQPTTSPHFLQVLEQHRPIAIFISDSTPKVGEGLWRC